MPLAGNIYNARALWRRDVTASCSLMVESRQGIRFSDARTVPRFSKAIIPRSQGSMVQSGCFTCGIQLVRAIKRTEDLEPGRKAISHHLQVHRLSCENISVPLACTTAGPAMGFSLRTVHNFPAVKALPQRGPPLRRIVISDLDVPPSLEERRRVRVY
jgi:hypothetical protein